MPREVFCILLINEKLERIVSNDKDVRLYLDNRNTRNEEHVCVCFRELILWTDNILFFPLSLVCGLKVDITASNHRLVLLFKISDYNYCCHP